MPSIIQPLGAASAPGQLKLLNDGRYRCDVIIPLQSSENIPNDKMLALGSLYTDIYTPDSDESAYANLILSDQTVGASETGGIAIRQVYLTKGPTTERKVLFAARLVFPFAEQGDLATREIHQDYIVNKGNYAAPTPGTAYVSGQSYLSPEPSGSFYLLKDTDAQDAGADSIVYTRIWSTVPQPRTVPNGTYPYRYPALPTLTPDPAATTKTITAVSGSKTISGTNYPYSTKGGNLSTLVSPTFTTSTSHGLSVKDWVKITITWDGSWPYGVITRYCTVTAVPTSTTFTVDMFQNYQGSEPNTSWGTSGFSSGTSLRLNRMVGREKPRTYPVDSYIVYDYALVGVTTGVSQTSDFISNPYFNPVITATQMETDTLTTGTTPTIAEYAALISANDSIVATSSVNAYKGSAVWLERATLYVPAK